MSISPKYYFGENEHVTFSPKYLLRENWCIYFPPSNTWGENDTSLFSQKKVLGGKMIHPFFPKSILIADISGNERVGILSLCKRPGGISSIDERIVEWKRIGARHEEDNARFKSFGIWKQVYRHALIDHVDLFSAVAVLVQLEFEEGECLFDHWF